MLSNLSVVLKHPKEKQLKLKHKKNILLARPKGHRICFYSFAFYKKENQKCSKAENEAKQK